MLGLDAVAADPDGDGIAAGDNCPTVPNPDQHDIDGDGIGDACDPCNGKGPTGVDANNDGIDDGCSACQTGIDNDQDGIDDSCDPCLRGGPHDEDGDHVPDACDNCPVDPNPDQVPADNSPFGVACGFSTIATGATMLQAFDAFDPTTTPWSFVGPGWSQVDDALAVNASGLSTRDAIVTVSFRFVVQTRVQVVAGTLGLRLNGSTTDCALGSDGVLSLNVIGMPPISSPGVDTTGKVTIRLAGVPLSGTSTVVTLRCEAIDDLEVTSLQLVMPSVTGRISLLAASATGTFDYLWAIQLTQGHGQ